MVRAKVGCVVAVRPEDEICRLRIIKDEDLDAIQRFGDAYCTRFAESVDVGSWYTAVGAASAPALAGEDDIGPHVSSLRNRDPEDLTGRLVEPTDGQITQAKYKLAQRADEQAHFFP